MAPSRLTISIRIRISRMDAVIMGRKGYRNLIFDEPAEKFDLRRIVWHW